METMPATHTLQTRYEIAPQTVRQFETDGFVKLDGVLDPGTLRRYEREITAQVKELTTEHRPLDERDTYGKAFLQVSNLWRHGDIVKDLVFSERLAGIATALLQTRGVRLYHDQALYKESGGGITPWHADQYYWPLSNDRTVTAWVPLQETPLDMGPLSFARGSHHFRFGRDLPISDESEATLEVELAKADFPHVEEPFALGDVSFHRGWTFHRAGANRSGRPRAVMTVIYMDVDIEVIAPTNDYHRLDAETWLPGTSAGEVPDGPLNPVLHTAAGRTIADAGDTTLRRADDR
jgi:ectoine hydroxylase-related dioxygenase (phytanoyl-CoA dioxygenase family)